jgi:hypothetical protein
MMLTSRVSLLSFLCLQVNFENLLGGSSLGDIANEFIFGYLPNIVGNNEGPVSLEISEAIKDVASERLVGVTLGDLLKLVNNSK